MQSQRTQPGTSHRDQLFGEKKDQTTFPALTQGQNQQDPNVFGFQSSLGKRKYEDSGFLGGQTLPRLEMPASIASDNGSSGRFPQIHNNHSNENRLNSNSPSIKSVSPKDSPRELNFKMQTPVPKREKTGDSPYRLNLNESVHSNLQIELAHDLAHSSVVCCVRFSSDGKLLATGSNRKAQIYSVETGAPVATFQDHTVNGGDLYLRSLCFSPNGKYLACGAEDKTVKLWDIEKEEMAHTFTGHNMDIYSVDYSFDGKFIASGSGDKKVKIWDVERRKCMFTLGNDEVGPKDGVTSVAISPDGRLIAAGSLDRVVRLWDAQTGYFLERYEGHLDSVYAVAFSPDGKSLASGSLDKTLKLWDLSESRSRSQCRSTFTGHNDFVLSVAFSANGEWLISGSKDRTVQFWDPRSVVSHAILEGHKNSVISVAVNPKFGSFATGSGDFQAKLWHYQYSN